MNIVYSAGYSYIFELLSERICSKLSLNLCLREATSSRVACFKQFYNFRQIFSILLSTFSQDVWCGSLTEMSEFKWDSDVNYYYCGSGSLIDVQNWIFKLKEFNVRPPSISSDICPIDQETISNWPFIWKLEREKYLSYQFTLHSQTFDLFYQNLWE